MKSLWFVVLASAIGLTPSPKPLEIRVDPSPLYVFDLSPDRGLVDLLLHNILVVNPGKHRREIRGLRVELSVAGEIVSMARVSAASVGRRAERIAGLNEAGVLKLLDFQFHLSRLLKEGERLSADALLDRGEAYLHTGLYVSATTAPDAARIVVEGARGDLAEVSIPVSRYHSPNTYRAPVDGRWFVFASGDAAHHHRWVI